MPASRAGGRGGRGAQRRLEFNASRGNRRPRARGARGARGGAARGARGVVDLYQRPAFRRSVEDASQILQDADAHLVAMVDGMSNEELRAAVLDMARAHPPLQWRVLGNRQHPSAPPSPPAPGPSDPDPPGAPEWCSCGGCRDMPVAADRICCDRAGRDGGCLRTDPECRLYTTTPAVVALGMLYHGERAAVGPVNLAETEALNRGMRWQAYRNFILWWWGSLGRGNRQRLPSCVIWAIRDAYPSPAGTYVGFREVLLEL